MISLDNVEDLIDQKSKIVQKNMCLNPSLHKLSNETNQLIANPNYSQNVQFAESEKINENKENHVANIVWLSKMKPVQKLENRSSQLIRKSLKKYPLTKIHQILAKNKKQ